MLELGVKVLIAYLIGSLNGSLVLARLIGGADIRTQGSGNAGGTNALRTHGKRFALAVVLMDVSKGFLVARVLPGYAFPGVPVDPEISRIWLTMACAGATIIGHCYPVWFDFSGGKGAATSVGALTAVAPDLLLPGAAVWLLVLLGTGFVGLATITAAAAMPLYVILTGASGRHQLLAFLALLAAFILYTHRSNIRRMLRGEENRMAAAMLLRRPQ